MGIFKNVSLAVIIAASSILAGCSSGPSETEMKSALISELETQFSRLSAITGKKIDSNEMVQNLVSHGCEAVDDREGYYKCDIEVTVKDPNTKTSNTKRDMAVFYMTQKGWVIDKH